MVPLRRTFPQYWPSDEQETSPATAPVTRYCMFGEVKGMSSLRSGGKRSVLPKSLYICPRCQPRRLAPGSQPHQKASALTKAATRRGSQHDILRPRHFSSTTHPSSTEAAATPNSANTVPPLTSPSPVPLHSFKSRAYIRDQLKAWSVENQIQKADEAKRGNAPVHSRKFEIPKSQWLEEDADAEGKNDNEYVDFDASEHRRHDFDELSSRDTRVLPGDIVLVEGPGQSKSIVMCLTKIGESGFWFHQNGQWSTTPWRSMDYNSNLGTTIHNFATKEEIAPLLELMPKKAVYEQTPGGALAPARVHGYLPRQVTDPLAKRLKGLFERMKVFRRSHLKTHDNLYDQLADDVEYVYMRFDHLIQKAFNLDFDSLDDAGRISVYLLIHHDPIKMLLIQPASESALGVLIVPRKTAWNNAEVIKWSRRYQQAAADASKGHNVREALAGNPLTSFIDKARRIILKSRRIRSPTTLGCLGPSNEATKHEFVGARESSGEEFSKHDKMIIGFMWDAYARAPQPKNRNKHHAVASLILRAVGAYPKMQLDGRIGRLFLQELGTQAPWNETRHTNVVLPAPGQIGLLGRSLDRHRDRIQQLSKDWPLTRAEGQLPAPDSLSNLRKDLGDLPVLCIDRRYASVIDDGISLESCEERPGAWLIHVHIAHPSAFFSPNHPVSQGARAMGASLYASGSNHFMIDSKLAKYLSLSPGAESFTISTMLNEDGEVLDIKVAATRVNNVVRLQKDTVSHLMEDRPMPMAYMIVGPDRRIEPHNSEDIRLAEDFEMSKKYLPVLNKMKSLLHARYRQRQKEVPVHADFWNITDDRFVSVNWEEPNDRDRKDQSFHYLSDPTIRLQASKGIESRRVSQRDLECDIVTHAMWLCCESFGKWLKDRQVPAVYHGAEEAIGFPLSKLNTVERDERVLYPSPNIQPEPRPHASLNMQQFCRITSPLRRFPDLIGQWNADAYLKAEAVGLIEPEAPASDLQYPMPKSAIHEYLKSDFWVIKYSELQGSMAFVHWAFQALFRAFHFKEAVLPEVWDVQVTAGMVAKDRHHEACGRVGNTIPFKLRVFLLSTKEEYELKADTHQFLPCKIELVDVTEKYIAMRPVGEATDEPQFEWKDVISPDRIEQQGGVADMRAARMA